MQQRFGVTTGLRRAFKDQCGGGRKGNAVETRCHGAVAGITAVLAIHDLGHPLECLFDLFACAETVMQPVGNMLAGDAQRGAIFHEADVVDIRHLGTTHTRVDPPHHVAKNALAVVIQLMLDLFG